MRGMFAKSSPTELAKQRKKIDACLGCNLPVHVCCGIPSQCKERYERYKVEMEKAKLKWDKPKANAGEEDYGKKEA